MLAHFKIRRRSMFWKCQKFNPSLKYATWFFALKILRWRGVVYTLKDREHYAWRSWELGAPNGSERLNTRMSADVHVIPACHGSAASTGFPLFVHLHNWRIHPPVCPTPVTVHETYRPQISSWETLFGIHGIKIYSILKKKKKKIL